MSDLANKYLKEYIENKYENIHDLKMANEYEEKIEWNRYLFDDDIRDYVDDAVNKLHEIQTNIYTKMYEHFDDLKDSEKLACLIWLNKDSHALQDEIVNRFNTNETLDYRLKVAYWYNHQDEVLKPSILKEIEYDEDTLETIYYGYKKNIDPYEIQDFGYIKYDGKYFNRKLKVVGIWTDIRWTLDDVYLNWNLKLALEAEGM